MIAHFVDIGGIVDHHFLNFLFIMNSYVLPFITLLAKTSIFRCHEPLCK